uniref:Fibrillar collagen NC1 domain-containing protein n=2 Tax=Denticeps clupeoides TaxID=299321 RepID=A0AAY4A5Q0_9TELE
MNFLQLLSLGAEQSITIHCLNITMWSSTHSLPPSQQAIRFRGWGGASLEPIVLEDTCWQRDGQWHQVRILFEVTDPALLPVTHIDNLPEATPISHYHLEVGPVCFH